MRLTAFWAGLFLCAGILSVQNPQAQAATEDTDTKIMELASVSTTDVLNVYAEPEAKPAQPQPAVEYVVSGGDSLVKIAEQHGEKWQRLFNKNVQIADPNVINPGDKIIIPTRDEVLADRPLPVAAPAPVDIVVKPAAKSVKSAKPVVRTAVSVGRGSSAGNTYYYGYCTWYAKERRPDLPNNLGNAATWVSRAAAQGIPTGSTPRVGAIGQQGNHVVYVEQVNGDGTIVIREMNFAGVGVITTRTVSASSHTYIY